MNVVLLVKAARNRLDTIYLKYNTSQNKSHYDDLINVTFTMVYLALVAGVHC